MNSYLFLDESGDHGLSNIDPGFPVFVLCGVLMSHDQYLNLGNRVKELKQKYWGNKKVILHSSDIRKWQNEFQVLFDEKIRADFYTDLNSIMREEKYTIIASAVLKEPYINKYGKLADDIYNISLSYIIERAVFFMDDVGAPKKRLSIHIEKRGNKEDALLSQHIQKVMSRGTSYVTSERIKSVLKNYKFYKKSEDIIGLQVADLVAYPIARYAMDINRANPAFDLISDKFYCKGANRYGLKIYP